MKKVLILGHSGKIGSAVMHVFQRSSAYRVKGVSSAELDLNRFSETRALIRQEAPDILINAVAMLGIDACEKNPNAALHLNTYLPQLLLQCQIEQGGILVHFSSEAVFSGALQRPPHEYDTPDPLNLYGHSKYLADLLIQAVAAPHYIFRLPVLFGPSRKRGQLLERMLDQAQAGASELRLANDIITSPTYSLDVAETLLKALTDRWPFGLYHVHNAGIASLFDLVSTAVRITGLPTRILPASSRDFPSYAPKNTFTPLCSQKIPAMRPWQEALEDALLHPILTA